jgi:hypothetical protein
MRHPSHDTSGDAYARAYPFDRLVEGMLQPEMILETVEIMRTAIEKGLVINVIINNRAGGNAPMIASLIAEKFIGERREMPPKVKWIYGRFDNNYLLD